MYNDYILTKSLYNEKYFSLTEDGRAIDTQTTDAIKEIFKNWVTKGYSPRGISQIMQSAVAMEELYTVLGIANAEVKKKKEENK